jgi:tetratricopeptide (TPR) repeat protein
VLQDEIAGLVAKNLAVSLGVALPIVVASAGGTKNLAAHDAYLKGRARHTGAVRPRTGDDNAVFHYGEAVRLDPEFALAWARLAQFETGRWVTGFDRSETRAMRTRGAAETALRLAPELPEAHLALAMVHLHLDGHHERAQAQLAEAERRRPNDAEVVRTLAQLEWVRGRWNSNTAALVLRAVELDPQNLEQMDTHCQILTETGRFAEAENLCQRWLALSSRNESALLRQSRNQLTWTGDQSGALGLLKPASSEPGQFTQRRSIARAALLAGMKDFAAAIVEYDGVLARGSPQGRNSGPRGNRCIAASWLARLEVARGNGTKTTELAAESLTIARQYANDFPEMAVGAVYVAISHAIRGEKAEALAAIDDAMRRVALTRDASQIARTRRSKAEVLTLLNEKDAAIAELRAIHGMGFALGYRLRAEFEWAPLSGEPKFQQLMKEAEARADAQPQPKKELPRDEAR